MKKRTFKIAAANITFCGVTIKKDTTIDTDRMLELAANLPDQNAERLVSSAIKRLIGIGAAVEITPSDETIKKAIETSTDDPSPKKKEDKNTGKKEKKE